MHNLRRAAVALLVSALTVLSPGLALAAATKPVSSNTIVQTCQRDGYQLPGQYSVAQLRAAYDSIPTSVVDYTTCAQVIVDKLNAELNDQHLKDSGSRGSSGFPVVVVVIIVVVLLGVLAAGLSYLRSRRGGDPGRPA